MSSFRVGSGKTAKKADITIKKILPRLADLVIDLVFTLTVLFFATVLLPMQRKPSSNKFI